MQGEWRSIRAGESPKRIVADGYDRLGSAFSAWVAQNPPAVRSWFGEVLARLGSASTVLELGCGPGTAAAELSAGGHRYIGVDLSMVQLSYPD